MQVASFLHRELPVRLAHKVKELESIPIMCASKHVQEVLFVLKECDLYITGLCNCHQVCNWYKESFQELRETPVPLTSEKEEDFANLMQR